MNNSSARFSSLPTVDIQRSVFDRSSSLLTTFNAGNIVPIYVDEVLPGDTCTMDLSTLCRMTTPIFPVMDDAFLDIHFFFVPTRLVWDNSKYFFGEANKAWESNVEYQIPHVHVTSSYTLDPGKTRYLSYFGIPIGYEGDINCLPFRCYELIYREWYRDQNLIQPNLVNTGDTETAGGLNTFRLRRCAKYHDYFTSALPSPQRGDSVVLPLGDLAPVLSCDQYHSYSTAPLNFTGFGSSYAGISSALFDGRFGGNRADLVGESVSTGGPGSGTAIYPANLWANLEDASSVSVNALREAFAVQRLLEKDARGGSRYRELVKQHFGVETGDARVQVPEYLGGRHIPITVNQVVQQSATNVSDGSTPLGNTAAFSKTVDSSSVFTKSFVEHGYIIGLAMVRTKHTYQQGVNKLFLRKDRFDFYWPSLAYIGEQPILEAEIYGNSPTPENVFGYQEAWADYRYKPNLVTGSFCSDVDGSLDAWHYADDYDSTPTLGKAWIEETDSNINRTLAVQSELADQFLLNCYFKAKWARPMPLYSIPGMRDYF